MQLQCYIIVYVRYYFYNTVFQIKHKLYIASGSVPTPLAQWRFLGARLISHQKVSVATEQNLFDSIGLLQSDIQLYSHILQYVQMTAEMQ